MKISIDKKIVLISLGLLVILSMLKLHGFSFSVWHKHIDNSKQEEILVGKARGIRSDDWAVSIPYSLSQVSHDPSYSSVNSNIGAGHNMLVLSAPVLNILTLFRPATWGYFIGQDFGIAWQWWLRVVLLFISVFLILRLFTSNVWMAFWASLAYLFMPFVQLWSINSAEITSSMLFACFFFISFSKAKNLKTYILPLLLFTYFACTSILNIYPPYQVSLGYVCLFVLACAFVANKDKITLNFWKICFVCVSGLLVLSVVYLFVVETKDVLNIISNTVYPGKRSELGGGYQLSRLLSGFFFFYRSGNELNAAYGNLCEASSYLFLFPLVIVASYFDQFRNKKIDRTVLVLLFGVLFFLVWMFFGFPSFVGKLTLMDKVQSTRAIIGLGVLNIVLLVHYLSHGKKTNVISRGQYIIYACWEVLLLYVAYVLHFQKGMMNTLELVLSFVLMSTISFLVIRKSKYAIQALFVVCFLYTIAFNPLVVGGYDFIRNNPISQEMAKIDKDMNGGSNWLVYGDTTLSNLPRMIGLKSLGGTHMYPQFKIWEVLDPKGLDKDKYNRYSYVTFLSPISKDIYIEVPQADTINVYADPSRPEFKMLGVTHVLVAKDDTFFRKNTAKFKNLFNYSDKHIYEIKNK